MIIQELEGHESLTFKIWSPADWGGNTYKVFCYIWFHRRITTSSVARC